MTREKAFGADNPGQDKPELQNAGCKANLTNLRI